MKKTQRVTPARPSRSNWVAPTPIVADEVAERDRMILERIHDDAIFTTDAEGRILTWAPGADDWRETGVIMEKPDAAPRRMGQGRELITLALPYQLGAETSYRFEPDGVHCILSVPLQPADRG